MLQMKIDKDRLAGLRDIHDWKCGPTSGWTPARDPSYKLTRAFGYGELKSDINH